MNFRQTQGSCFRRPGWLGLALVLGLAGCHGLTYPVNEKLSTMSFEPRHEPEQIELYFQRPGVAKTVRTGSSHGVDPVVDSGAEEVARSFPVPGRSRVNPPEQLVFKVRKLRTNLIAAETPEPVDAERWPDEVPPLALPSDEMIDEGLQQLQQMAAEAGADAVQAIYSWVIVDEIHFGVGGAYEFRVVPRGIVLEGIAVRYRDR